MMTKQGSSIHSGNDEAGERLLVAGHLQALEGNPLNAEDLAMFAMFERECWPDDKRRAYIRERALADSLAHAAE